MKSSIMRGILAAALAAALGFGGAQAVASPAAGAQAVRGCTPESCQKKCMTQHGVDGFCTGRGCWCLR